MGFSFQQKTEGVSTALIKRNPTDEKERPANGLAAGSVLHVLIGEVQTKESHDTPLVMGCNGTNYKDYIWAPLFPQLQEK